jgi:hypothetical protein
MVVAGSMLGVSGSCVGIVEFLNLGYSLMPCSKKRKVVTDALACKLKHTS